MRVALFRIPRLVVASARPLQCSRPLQSASDSHQSKTSQSGDDVPWYHPSSNPTPHNGNQYDDAELFQREPLYEHHIPTNPTQRLLLSIGSAAAAITDPYRDDMVAVFGETTGHKALKNMLIRMQLDEEGSQILADRPRITSASMDLDRLRTLPDGSLGREYARFLDKNKVTPDTRREVHFVDDKEFAYVMQRYREVHDFLHALLEMPTNVMGEVVVKWVEAIQTGLPMCWTAAAFGPLQIKSAADRRKYLDVYLPWALETGHHARPLFNVYFERRLEQNVADLRRELGIPDIPTV